MVLLPPPVAPPLPADPVEPHHDALPAVLPVAEVELRAGVELLQAEGQVIRQGNSHAQKLTVRVESH